MSLSRRDFLWLLGGVLAGCGVDGREPDYTVVIERDHSFAPSSLVIPVGVTVAWHNRAESAHTVTTDPDKALTAQVAQLPAGVAPFDSGDLYPGDRWVYTFDTPGSYVYFCQHHQLEEMFGVVRVEA
jgi:plastocyanin